jgi:hypothetical protein
MVMPVQQNSLTHLRVLLVLHDCGIQLLMQAMIMINMLMLVN